MRDKIFLAVAYAQAIEGDNVIVKKLFLLSIKGIAKVMEG